MSPLLKQPTWRVMDQSSMGPDFDGRQSFAIDDTLCRSVGSGESPCAARLWVHQRTVMLGIQDTRMPHLQDALRVLSHAGFDYVARNSGGLAVVLDDGVLNLSLIFSEKKRPISIDEAYQAMVDFIGKLLGPHGIRFDVHEIGRSYCPGRYDLSVGGRKFAGISQRRVKRGVAVQIYLCVSGSGPTRGSLIRDFYRSGVQDEKTRLTYPDIDPSVMASLEEIDGQKWTVTMIRNAVFHTLRNLGTVVPSRLSPLESEHFGYYYERMIRRNEKAFAGLSI
ncbi:lipoate--protein ligase family protein [Sporolactobacillus sp. THM7-7]|nr:lipoate--protein ligase family protein [Sporolactobacillus sp. THM7-7]